MYDTLRFTLHADDAPNADFMAECTQHLQGVTVWERGGITGITGYLDKLKVCINDNTLKIVEGSLPKWYLGNNLDSLTMDTTKAAIEKLSDTLHAPMWNATVNQIDAGWNFVMDYPVRLYLEHLGNMSHHTRLSQPDGLYYQNGIRKLVFYDKVKEQKNRKCPIPPQYKGENVLRFEWRCRNRLAQELKYPKVTARDLYDEKFYHSLNNRLIKHYYDIEKLRDVTVDFDIVKSKKGLYEVALAYLVEQHGGEVGFIKSISEAQGINSLTKKQSHDIREAVKKAGKSPVATKPNTLIEELNEKVVTKNVNFC